MKKTRCFSMLVLFLFAIGCAGGGGGQTSSGAPPGGGGTGSSLPAGYGYITLDFRQGNTEQLAPNGGLPSPTAARIAIRLFITYLEEIWDPVEEEYTGEFREIQTEYFRKIVDITLPAVDPISIPVPAANNYSVEVITSTSDGNGGRIMMKYGKVTGVNVSAGISSNAPTIMTHPIADGLTIELPESIVAGSQYSIPVTINNIPLRNSFRFQQRREANNSEPVGLFVDDASSPLFSGIPSFTAETITVSPSGNVYWDLYFQGLFFIDDSWKMDTENPNFWMAWKFYYPNPTDGFSDLPIKTKLFPLGTIGIIIQ